MYKSLDIIFIQRIISMTYSVVGQNVIFHHGGLCPLKATPPEHDFSFILLHLVGLYKILYSEFLQ